MKVPFFTAIDYGNFPKTAIQCMSEKVDNYFFLGGRKARVVVHATDSTGHGIEWVYSTPSFLSTCAKVASYFSIVIPLIMLIAKAILRSRETFYELEKKREPPASKPINSPLFKPINSPLLLRIAPAPSFSKPYLNLDDFIQACAPHRQAMIYGTATCGYADIRAWLDNQKDSGLFRDVFDHLLGEEECPPGEDYASLQHKTSDKRVVAKIHHGTGFMTKGMCKAGLVNIVIENMKRNQEGIPIIPIVFVVEKDDEKLDIIQIANTASTRSKGFTNSEIRRAYRLCFDPDVGEQIRDVARKTFSFISLTTNAVTDSVQYSFSKRPAPWESAQWHVHWKNKDASTHSTLKPYPWREELTKALSR